MDMGLLIGRVVFGALFAAHGLQKLCGWFRGYGLDGTGAFFEGLGFRPGRAFAATAGLTECACGALLVLGLAMPVAAAGIMAVMLVAIVTVHRMNGLLATSNGVELPTLYTTAAVSLALTGPGIYSLDAWLGLSPWWTPSATVIVLAGGAAGAVANLSLRRAATVVAPA